MRGSFRPCSLIFLSHFVSVFIVIVIIIIIIIVIVIIIIIIIIIILSLTEKGHVFQRTNMMAVKTNQLQVMIGFKLLTVSCQVLYFIVLYHFSGLFCLEGGDNFFSLLCIFLKKLFLKIFFIKVKYF